MEIIKLIRPSAEYKSQLERYRKDFMENNEHIYGSGGLTKFDNIEEWLEDELRKRVNPPEHLVPADTYFLFDEDNDIILGSIQLRHYLNEALLKTGGHIGYSISPYHRRRGYAKLMLKMVLDIAKIQGFTKVLITCNKENTGSARTIIANNGIKENEVFDDDGIIIERYWITI